MNQSISTESKAKTVSFPWDLIMMTLIWLVIAYYSVAFPHKTFNLSFLEVPMTPLLLFFATSLILVVYVMVTQKEDFGISLVVSLIFNFLVFLPVPIAWFLLWFYEVDVLPSFLAILVVPVIFVVWDVRDWLRGRERGRGIRSIPETLKLVGFYIAGMFFGYGTIITMSYLYCYFTNQSFEMFARANPAVLLLGGATIMAGILALSRPSR